MTKTTSGVYQLKNGFWAFRYAFMPNGKIQTVNSMKCHSKKTKETLGISFKYHYLRHTYGTRLAQQNIPPTCSATKWDMLAVKSQRSTTSQYRNRAWRSLKRRWRMFEKERYNTKICWLKYCGWEFYIIEWKKTYVLLLYVIKEFGYLILKSSTTLSPIQYSIKKHTSGHKSKKRFNSLEEISISPIERL